MIDISVKSNVDEISKKLSAFAYTQLPFATAKAVNSTAVLVQEQEKRQILSVFDSPTPFTVNSVAIKRANKALPFATVFIKDKAAQYLEPYEYGGTQFLGSKPADLVPVQQAANQYGNLPRGILAKYKDRKDCFIGTVKTKRGPVYGLWQRPTAEAHIKGVKQRRMANTTGGLKLLVAFHKPVETRKRLHFGDRAQSVVNRNFNSILLKEIGNAIKTAKL